MAAQNINTSVENHGYSMKEQSHKGRDEEWHLVRKGPNFYTEFLI